MIERLIALVTYANAILKGRADTFDIDILIGHHCYNMEFIEPHSSNIPGSTKIIAANANKWISYLRDGNAEKVLLHFRKVNQFSLPDHITAAFIGGGSEWLIEVRYPSGSNLYTSATQGSGGRKDQVALIDRNFSQSWASPSVIETRRALDEILGLLTDFAKEHEHSSHWSRTFEAAREALAESQNQDLEFIPEGIYSLEAHHLIAAGFRSWVFGGMGSWNDMSFNDDAHEKYTVLTEQLYQAICSAFVAGVNSFP
ncbi:MAG: hypothetical protein ACFFED_15100 [Candidatus Thorarchaeota archaeon]